MTEKAIRILLLSHYNLFFEDEQANAIYFTNNKNVYGTKICEISVSEIL